LVKRAFPVPVYRDSQIIASQTNARVGSIVLDRRARIPRIDFSLEVQGSSGTVTAVTARVGGTAISEAVNPATGAGTKTGSLRPLSSLKDFAPGTVVEVVATTAANSTIDSAALNFSVDGINNM
jgi:hypothetical protein